MSNIWVYMLFIWGLLMIIKGGDWFLDAIIWISERTGISLGIIGATIVSLATTLPEFFVSTVASRDGFTDMAVGNSIGSCICNIAFIIGISALIRPIKVKEKFFGAKGIMMIGYLLIFFYFAMDGLVTHNEGKILIFLILFFVLINILDYRKGNLNTMRVDKKHISKKDMVKQTLKFLMGITFIIIGANILVDTGVEIANILRIPKQVVSLTLLALGTSLPELITALSSIKKDKQSVSLGNIIGANILNLTVVLGGSALVSSNGLIISQQTLGLDIFVAIFVAVIFILSGVLFKKINRIVGIILLFTYGAYLIKIF